MTLEFGITARAGPAAPAKAAEPVEGAARRHHFSFRTLLSELNPLQYIPVIGTLFRAVTGEVIPEPVRDAGALVFSTLIAGPIGAAIDLGELAAEKVTGIDPEKIGDRLLGDVGIGDAAAPAGLKARPAVAAEPVAAPVAWSHAQLAAYGVTTTAGGELEQAGVTGSDVLNGLELARIHAQDAATRYAAAAPNAG